MANFVKAHFDSLMCFFLCMLSAIVIVSFVCLPMIDRIGILVFSLAFSVFGGFVVDTCDGN